MSTAPAPIAPIYAGFQGLYIEEKMMEAKAHVEKFNQDLLGCEPQVRAACIAMAALPGGLAHAISCYAAYRLVPPLVPPFIDAFNDMYQWVASPENLIDIADAMKPAYDHATDCAQALLRAAMPADQYWMGDAVDAYYGYIEGTQNKASRAAEATIKALMDGVREAGTSALTATYVALGALIGALIELIVGLLGLIPPVTPAGAAVIALGITAAGAIIAALIAFAKTREEITSKVKTDVDGKLRSNDFPGGKWPKPDSAQIRSKVQDVGGWDYDVPS